MAGEHSIVPWLRARGGYVSPKLDLFKQVGDDGNDRCVSAREAIKEGEQLLLVPVDATLHLPTAQEWKDSPPQSWPAAVAFLRQHHPSLSPFVATTLLLLSEMAKGQASGFGPYVEALPETSDCLFHWSPEEQALLQGTSIECKGRSLRQVFEDVVAPILGTSTQLWPPPFNGFEAFRRAADMVQSRAFHMLAENWVTGTKEEGDELFLIPCIDMLNHSSDPQRRSTSLSRISDTMSVEVDGVPVTFNGFFTMTAARDIAAGEQVLHSYGDLADAQLLQTYGFVEALPGFTNPHNYALLPWHTLAQAARTVLGPTADDELSGPLLQRKVAFLASCGVLHSVSPTDTEFILTAATPLPSELLTAIQVLLMLEEEFEQLQSEHQAQHSPGSSATEAAPGSSSGRAGGSSSSQGADGSGVAGSSRQAGTSSSSARGSSGAQGTTAQHAAGGDSGGAGLTRQGAASSSGRAGPSLVLGDELLEGNGEFAEMVAAALLQAIGLCQARYPATAAATAAGAAAASGAQRGGRKRGVGAAGAAGRAAAGGAPSGSGSGREAGAVAAAGGVASSRAARAAAVVAGERAVLQAAKKAALLMMMRAAEGGSDEEEDEVSDEEAEDEEPVSSDDEEEEAAEPASKRQRLSSKQQKQQRQQQTQQQEGQEEEQDDLHQEAAEQQQQRPKRQTRGRQTSVAAAGREAGSAGEGDAKGPKRKGRKDKARARGQFGDMRGPTESDVWASDDSDKVGYGAPAASGGQGGAVAAGVRARGVPAGQDHLYEEGADGHVRERYGAMVGPDEEEFIDSEDSEDKVGYAE